MSTLPAVADRSADASAATSAPSPSALGDRVLFAIPIVLSALVYVPITRNYFFADDFLHLFRIRNEDLVPYLVIPRAGHMLVTFNSIFYVASHLFGTNPQPYFWLSLATHLVNVGLLFSVIRLFTDSARVACFGAALWGISPLNESALGWFSVYGQVVVATCLLLVLRGIARVAAGYPTHRWAPLWWCALLLAASMSFGVGIGITLTFPLVAFLLLPPSPARTRILITLCILAVALPPFYLEMTSITTALYNPRTAPAIVNWDPLTNLTMLAYMLGFGIRSLIAGYFTPVTDRGIVASIPIALFVAGILATLVRAPWPVKRQLFACMILVFSCYGIIVAGRAAYFAMAGKPDAFVRPGRYHYVAPIPLAIALCVMLAYAQKALALRPALQNGMLAGWFVVAASGYVTLAKPIDHHPQALRETNWVLDSVRKAIDATAPQQDVVIPNRPFQSLGPIFAKRQDIFPGWAGVFVIFYPENVVDGKKVRFVTTEPETLIAAREGHRTTTLIIGAEGM